MAQLNLYYRTQLTEKVSLLPEQINGNIDKYLLENLKNKIEGKVISLGYVLKIIQIISYDNGMADKSNFMGTTVYRVVYECFICSPIRNLIITCILQNKLKEGLLAHNGPITIFIYPTDIDPQKFEINDKNILYKKNGSIIDIGAHLKVSILNSKIALGEKTIVAVCKLLDIADSDDINNFEKDQKITHDKIIKNNDEFI